MYIYLQYTRTYTQGSIFWKIPPPPGGGVKNIGRCHLGEKNMKRRREKRGKCKRKRKKEKRKRKKEKRKRKKGERGKKGERK